VPGAKVHGMSEISEYQQGTPCWVELYTPDRPAAMDFYRAVFGWEYRVAPEEQHSYTEALLKGRTVAGLLTPPGAAQPPTWVTYLATDDLDAALSAVAAHGGQALTGAIDVPGDLGVRVALVTDPTGGIVGAWEAKDRTGAQLANEPGTQIWNELMTGDPAAARPFYAAVFGLEISDPMSEDFDYTTIRSGGRDVGGIGAAADGAGAHWDTYFAVADTDAIAELVRTNGGTVLNAPADTPYGRMATCKDPLGATFNLMGTTSD
jgi:predicted enzyme related to lactoylglutathione lyase